MKIIALVLMACLFGCAHPQPKPAGTFQIQDITTHTHA